jgi:hypothetical protein
MRGPDDPTRPVVDPVTGQTVAAAGVDGRTAEQIRQDAYRAGVADERARHRRNPLLTILIALLAVLGLVLVVLYFVNNRSFSGAGRTLDEAAGVAGEQVEAGAREAADEAGEGLQDAGRAIEQRGEAPPGAYGDAVQSAPQTGAAATPPQSTQPAQ